jgi:primosomal protein N' (replication factor Y)
MLNSESATALSIVAVRTASTLAEPITGYVVGTKADGLVEVLVDCPIVQGLFTYNIPERLTVSIGDILSVPFGSQIVGGIAIRLVDKLPEGVSIDRIKDIDDVVASGLFKANYWQWLEQIADSVSYTHLTLPTTYC